MTVLTNSQKFFRILKYTSEKWVIQIARPL